MPTPPSNPPLAQASNGVVSPLYFDRQIVRAEDLTLDRGSHDRELARMRRLLHGWGVVAGFIPTITGTTLSVSAGYGITKSGDEVYLTEALEVPEIASRVWRSCGPEELACEVIDLEDRMRIALEGEQREVTSWLIARPTQDATGLRPGIPDGCAHPANRLMPTRACDVVALELLCALPPGLGPPDSACADLSAYICAVPATMLPMPPIPEPEENVLVLGQIVAGIQTARFEPTDRRAVLPVEVLQDWMRTCVCSLGGVLPEPRLESPRRPDAEPKPDLQRRDG